MPPKTSKKKTKNMEANPNECTNWYSKLPAHLTRRAPNPDIAKHGLELPFRAIVVGSSGSGKTSLLFEFLSRAQNSFSKVVIITRSAAEPLYIHLRETCDEDVLDVYEFLNDGIPSPDDYKGQRGNTLVVFDDLVSLSTKQLEPITDWYIRGRKLGEFGCSMMFLTQSYYKVPKTVRLQANVLMIKKLGSNRDLNLILNDTSLGLTKEQLTRIYKYATADKWSFLMIDLDKDEQTGKFRRNFLEKIEI
jgi:hypothetical protein